MVRFLKSLTKILMFLLTSIKHRVRNFLLPADLLKFDLENHYVSPTNTEFYSFAASKNILFKLTLSDILFDKLFIPDVSSIQKGI